MIGQKHPPAGALEKKCPKDLEKFLRIDRDGVCC